MHDDIVIGAKHDMDAVRYRSAIAGNIRAARARLGIEQRDLAKRMEELGYSWAHQTVSNVERCIRRPYAEELYGLSIALSVTLGELLEIPQPRRRESKGAHNV